MKIAIVTINFAGSSSSLAEAHLMNGNEVDFYHVMFSSQHNLEVESFTLPTISSRIGIKRVENLSTDGLRRFKTFSNKFHFYNVVCFGMPREEGLMNDIKRGLSLLVMRKVFKNLRDYHYDLINVIGQNHFSISLSSLLHSWNLPVIHSFHEVLERHLESSSLYPGIDKLINKGIRINVFSEKSAKDLKKVIDISTYQLSVIPFGLFSGYREYGDVEIPELNGKENYILFYGYIEKYKGLDILYEAINQIGCLPVKVVVAGKGNQTVLERIKNDERFILINRWLGNAELATLIRHSKCVVCPYLSASQSGIPQTVFNFDRPIIATDIESFEAVIQNELNGIIVRRNNVKEFADAIKHILNDDELYHQMVSNIKKYRECESIMEWKAFANRYLKKLKFRENEII